MDAFMWIMLALCFGFLAYLLYTRQFMWLLGVIKNAALGIAGIFVCNFLLAGFGVAVGVNAVTAVTVGLLGVPGFVLLYAAGVLLG